ncbi:MAG: hypothetical protein QOI53_4729, partial [Verrucomicrobiota bacterium]|nr:hypothetical protein [Verrucomicrobiota bacterium]
MAQPIFPGPFGKFNFANEVWPSPNALLHFATVNPGSRPRPVAGRLSNGRLPRRPGSPQISPPLWLARFSAW